MRQCRDHGHIGARRQRQVMGALICGFSPDRSGAGRSTISLPLAQPLLQAAGEDRVPVGRVGADDHHHVGMFDRIEILRAGEVPKVCPRP
jgi:hypothetical protein